MHACNVDMPTHRVHVCVCAHTHTHTHKHTHLDLDLDLDLDRRTPKGEILLPDGRLSKNKSV